MNGSSMLSNFIKNMSLPNKNPLLRKPSTDSINAMATDIEVNNNYTKKVEDYDEDNQSDEIKRLQNTIKLQKQQIDNLTLEIKILKQIENDQDSALECAMQHRRDLEKQLTQSQAGISANNDTDVENDLSDISGQNKDSETPFLDNSAFLRAFLRKDKAALDDLVKQITQVSDQNTHGLAISTLFQQMQLFMQLNHFFERLADESGTDHFISTFENSIRNFIDCKRIILWAYIPSAHAIVSHSTSMIVPENEGFLGKTLSEGQRLVITDPTRDASYSINYDAPLISNARVLVYQPAINSKKEIIWIIQVIDRLNEKGNVMTPSADDFLILDFLSLSLIKLHQEETRIDEMIKRILTESTRSLLTERQVMPLLETVQLTVTRIVGCESLQIFFADSNTNILFQLKEDANAESSSEVNISSVSRQNLDVSDAGIAGACYVSKKVINAPVAKEHQAYNPDVDGQYPNEAVIAVPLLSNKGVVLLVAVARQKKSGMMFTESDEIILEALSRVSQGALTNAQSHERNIAEIQNALNNHKYYTALLTVAQELSAVLDTDTLVRKIMTKAQSFIEADRCSLFLVDKVRGGLWSMVAHGATDRIHIPLGEGIAGHVAATGETLNIPDAYKDPRFNSAVDKSTGYRTRSILCVPITNGNGGIIGCTQMINKLGAPEFSKTDIELMTAFNVFCGIALSNAQLFEAATQSKKKMTAMLDIALSLSTSMTLDALVTNIMKRACELIEAEECWLFIHDRIHHLCKLIAGKSENSVEFSVKQGAVGYVTVTGAELNVEDPEHDRRYGMHDSELSNNEVRNMLVIPVIDASGQIVGVVEALNKKGMPKFTEEDQSLLRAFASFAGLALEQWISKRPSEFGQTADIELVEQLSPSELTSVELSDRMKIFDPLVGIVASNNFDVLEYQRNDQFRILIHFFEEFDLLSTFKISVGTLLRFLGTVYDAYLHVPFHNFNFAVDTTQFIFYELSVSKLASTFSKLELLVLLVACICHDIGYSNRSYALNTKAQVAFSALYKDQPVLEIFDCSSIINILSKPTCNILSGMDNSQLTEFWRLLIDIILANDVSNRMKLVSEIDLKLHRSNGEFDLSDQQSREMLLKLLVKCATHANLARAFDPSKSWSISVAEESLPRVDSRAEETFVTINDSDIKVANEQVKFIESTYAPLFGTLGNVVADLKLIEKQVLENLEKWKEIVDETKKDEVKEDNKEENNKEEAENKEEEQKE
ncbi:hypothetical protein M9Y10_021067 [Tritrichomonas musculus]|uniref:PDEase domain-containing protein n=1 Tax=Tritrichomonas musculus TaxID=1915356 RepID=A0ABR2HDR5_9EUKA